MGRIAAKKLGIAGAVGIGITDRGRDAHYWAPPAQNRTGGFAVSTLKCNICSVIGGIFDELVIDLVGCLEVEDFPGSGV